MNFEDEIVRGSLITRDGEIVHEATLKAMGEKVKDRGVGRAEALPSTAGRGDVPPQS